MQQTDKLLPIAGIKLAATSAGIKKNKTADLALFELAENTHVAAVFTQNVFCAAPVVVAKSHLQKNSPRYLLINSGNANAGLGEAGITNALSTCEHVAAVAHVKPDEILPFSTGVIGEPLPVNKINEALPKLMDHLAETNWLDVAKAIMTTDTRLKGISVTFELNGEVITVTGIAKGAGMIHPNMATMLAFIATDANIESSLLQKMLTDSVDLSFNCITVDGDTSTNDACVLIATGKANHPMIENEASNAYQQMKASIDTVCQYLAKAIIYDAEGATKFVTIKVYEGKTREECLAVAKTVATSPLVKTALFASDPNWGRILAAVGRSPIENLQADKVTIFLDDVLVVKNGERTRDYQEAQGAAVFVKAEITIHIYLGRGRENASVWTNDFSYDYVKINAEYRT